MILKYYVLDTNVLVSAVLLPNSVATLAYEKALKTGVVLASQEIIVEYRSVLLRPKFDRYVSREKRISFLDELIQGIKQVEIFGLISDCRDPKDNMYLEVAINGGADFLISGDEDLLILNPYRGIPIISPSDFYVNK